jgi:hypothetical protein
MTIQNGRTRRTRHKPNARWDAYDNLPPLTRRALQEGPQQWCDIVVAKRIKQLRKQHPLLSMRSIDNIAARMVEGWHMEDIAEAHVWQPARKPFERKPRHPVQSPHIAADATMQMSGRTSA